jgi:hypothetical protein
MLPVAPSLNRFHQLGYARLEVLRPEEDGEISEAALITTADILDRRGQLGH